MSPREEGWHHRPSKIGDASLLAKSLFVCLAIWGYLNLCIQLGQYFGDSDRDTLLTQDSTSNECACGSSVSEAKSLGCVFDALASAWLPPECRDDELTAEFNRSGPGPDGAWPYWADRNGTQPITTEDIALMGGDETVLVQHEGMAHGALQFLLAQEISRPPDRSARGAAIRSMNHIVHCGGVAMDDRPLDSIAVHAGVSLNSAA